jgi:hypothetical protein
LHSHTTNFNPLTFMAASERSLLQLDFILVQVSLQVSSLL